MNHPISHFLLIRHAHVDIGPAPGRLCGWLDLPLSAEGQRQVDALRDRRFVRERPDALYTSTLRRAREVAAALAEIWDLSPEPRDDLREITCGELEGLFIRDVARAHPGLLARNDAQTDDDFTWPGGESYRQLRQRVLAALSAIAAQHPGKRIAVVTHAGVVSQVLGTLKGRRAAMWQADRPGLLSATEVTWANGAPAALLRFGATD
jgi:broad specificity phosphatase PhoE